MLKIYEEVVLPMMLPSLRERKEGQKIGPGTLILFKKKALATFVPGWALGLVERNVTGSDGEVRSIVVKYTNVSNKKGTKKQPPTDEEDDTPEEVGTTCQTKSFKFQVVNTTRNLDEVIVLEPLDDYEEMTTLMLESQLGQE